jgi:hypothetical protein
VDAAREAEAEEAEATAGVTAVADPTAVPTTTEGSEP